MTEVRFYHLQTKPLELALPEILSRALDQGHRVVVRAPDKKTVALLNEKLWTYNPDSFLPHGSARDGNAESQPVWLTTADENPNRATMLVLLDGQSSTRLADYARCCDIFDGNDDAAVAAARLRWKEAKAAGHQLAYWEQTDGKWQKRGAAPAEGG